MTRRDTPVVVVVTRPQTPEEAKRLAAATRLLLADIVRQMVQEEGEKNHVSRRT